MVTMEVDHVDGQPNTGTLGKGLDELQYSRLIFTLGREAMEALHGSKVLIFGCKGLGAEIAKNLVLSGIGSVGLVDDGMVSISDLGANFLLREGDVDQNRAVCTVKVLKDLNPDALVEAVPSLNAETYLKNYNVVIATYGTIPFLIQLNQRCRSCGIPFIASRTRGVFGSVFADFGNHFLVKDETGESPGNIVIESITQDFPATVTEQRHGLEDGDQVVFHGIRGMEELNELVPITVSVTGSHSFTILVDTRQFGCYTSGGYFQKVKPSKTVQFLSLESALLAPKLCAYDPVKQQHNPDLHVAFQAIDAFERIKCPDSLAFNPVVIKEEEINEVILLARQVAAAMSMPTGSGHSAMFDGFEDVKGHENFECHTEIDSGTGLSQKADQEVDGLEPNAYGEMVNGQTEENNAHTGEKSTAKADKNAGEAKAQSASIDENLVKLVALGAHVELCPIVAIAGGIAAQEAIKAITGVFMPLNQWLYIDAVECLPAVAPSFQERFPSGSRYDAQVALFGRDLQEKLGHGQGYRLSSIDFDKDDEKNFHAEFVVAAANLRAQNYGICLADKLQARLIGGKAIPSIVNAAAVVGGLMCLEVYKILQEKPLEDYRHSYFNLALPMFTSARPIKAVENKVIRHQNEPLVWTLWDKFEMDCIGMSLQTFLAEFKRQHGVEMQMT